MQIALLGAHAAALTPHLRDDQVVWSTDDRVTAGTLIERNISLLVSFGYRHIIKSDALEAVGGRAFNIHISLLPWNKGADPNLWSWLENTPKGVTIHWMSVGVDEGDLITQRELSIDPVETLRSSYELLLENAVELFRDVAPEILSGAPASTPQQPGGSHHLLRDKEPHLAALHSGWDTPCHELTSYGEAAGLWHRDSDG